MSLTPQDEKPFSTLEVARMLGVGISSVSKWIDEGQLPAARTPGGHRRIAREDIVAFVHRQGFRMPPELQTAIPRMLVVDDDVLFTKWLAEEIGTRFPKAEIFVAHSVFSSGELVGLVKPDIIILNLHTKGMEGLETCRHLRSNPRTAHTAIIGITGHDDPPLRDEALKLGLMKCLVKPFYVEAVMAPIREALSQLGVADAGQVRGTGG